MGVVTGDQSQIVAIVSPRRDVDSHGSDLADRTIARLPNRLILLSLCNYRISLAQQLPSRQQAPFITLSLAP
jgi:hypothetical protein